MSRNRTPNGMLGKAIKGLTDLLKVKEPDPDRIRMKLRSAAGLAGSTEAVHRIVGDEVWSLIQKILNPPQSASAQTTKVA